MRRWFGILLISLFPCAAVGAQETPVLRLILAVPRDTAGAQADAVRGMRFGAAEAMRTAALFRASIAVEERAAGAGAVTPGRVTIAAGDAGECGASAEAVATADALVIDAACAAPAIRVCSPRVFRIAAPEAAPARDGGVAGVAGWHEDFHRYGAAQLNDRYRAEYGSGMTGAAWRGWFAVKVALDAALRAGSGAPGEIAAFLASPAARFDGHKGSPLRFDASRVLQSPSYSIEADGSVREMPFELNQEVGSCSDAG